TLAPRAVFFDVVGTLLHPEPSAAAVYASVGRRWGSTLSAAEIGRRFRAAFAAEEERDRAHGLRTDEGREFARWRDLVGVVLDDVGDPAGCFAELWEHFRRPSGWRADPDGLAAVRRLAGCGVVLGLASNFDRRLRDVLEGFPELRALPHVVISSEVGWRK